MASGPRCTSLRTYGGQFDQQARDELLATIQDEAERLNRFVGNLLDMTRLEAGALEPRLESVDLTEVVGTALNRTARLLANHRVEVDIPADLPALQADYVLLEQILVNLLDNAAKYTPPHSAVRLAAQQEGEAVVIEVMDEGEGIPPLAFEQIFEKFRRIGATDRQRAGTGLGLVICRGFTEALGGRIEVIRAIRTESQVPIVVLSIRSDERGKVQALDLGADDYVTKPFGIAELLARIRAALRHRLQAQGAQPVFRCHALTVDLVRRQVFVGEAEVRLSRKEYDVLAFLVTHAGKVVTHQQLLRAVWGKAIAADVQYLRVYMRQLRQKIEPNPTQPRYLLTEPGVGYRLSVAE